MARKVMRGGLNSDSIKKKINQVNLGEVALQMISLFLDPYPKSKSFNNIIENYNNKEEKYSIDNNNMFELLNNLKK